MLNVHPAATVGQNIPSIGGLAYKWVALIVSSVSIAIVSINVSIVSITLPAIGEDFGAHVTQLQWVVAIYPLVAVGLMLGLGHLSDVLGRKRIFAVGALLFAVGSVLCGLSQNPWQLIGSRVVQGIAAAIIMANYAAIVTDAFPSNERGKALGIQAMVASFGLTVGPTLGGWLVDTAGWRSVFLLPVPVALLTAVVALFLLRDRRRERATERRPFDALGAVLLFVTATSLLLALSDGQESGWLGWRVSLLMATFLVSLVALVVVEQRAVLPTIDLDLIRRKLFAAGSSTALIGQLSLTSVNFLTPFYLTRTVGFGSSETGLLISTAMVTMGVSTFLSGWLSDRLGSRTLCAVGMALSSCALATLAMLGAQPQIGVLLLTLTGFGAGYGLWLSPNSNAVLGATPAARLGMASALLATMRQMGSALGVTISGVVFTSRLAAYATPGVELRRADLFDIAASINAFRDAYLAIALICAVGIVTALVRETNT